MMSDKQRLVGIDGLRGMAAISVMLFHYSINNSGEKLGFTFGYGVTGVQLFFIISGFVILLSLKKVKNSKQFLINRFSRLYPIFWICVLITSTFYFLFEREHLNARHVLANLSMFPIYFGIENIDGSYWTLLVEMQFYLFMSLIFTTGNLRKILPISIGIILLILIVNYTGSKILEEYNFVVKKLQLINHFPLFFSGILFYIIKYESSHWLNWLLLLLNFLVCVSLYEKAGSVIYFVTFYEYSIILLLYHAIFYLSITNKLKFLEQKELLFLGSISYPLYLIHQYIGTNLIHFFNENWNINIYTAVLLAITLSITIAYFVNIKIEIPYNRKIKDWYRTKTRVSN